MASFAPPEVLLLGPGPSPTSPAVQRAQSLPPLGHLDPAFLPLLDRVQNGLRALFGPAAYRRAASRTRAAGTPEIDSVASGEWRGSAMNSFHSRQESTSQRASA